ncbi:MAG TPA: HAD family phosphatase [Sphingomicrobium sp.]|nr:HAD family phosphatase [Sphingomicrobium sp.]
MKSAILFDIDGTLVDSNEYHIQAWDEVFREAGHVFSREDLHRHIGKGGDTYVPSLLPGVEPEKQEEMADRHGRLYKARYIDQVKPFRGARDLLLRTRDSARKVVLASSASQEELEHYLELLDAHEIVDATTSKDDVAHSKPCPDIFRTAVNKAGVAPEAALVVGDTPFDMEAAGRAGIASVAVRSGKFRDEDLKGSLAIYDDVAALLSGFEASPLAN